MFVHTSTLFIYIILTVNGYVNKSPYNRDQQQQNKGCGFDNCDLGKPGYLNVHLIAHTHDDVGWLKTVDQYYYGANNYIQRAGVQYILDSVISALHANPARRFTYVEMAFFHRWWMNRSEYVRDIARQLVANGQLQFALGAWCMADEATVHYSDAIDQMTLGNALLKDLFGECGIVTDGWQIDPFGHSRDHSDLFTEAGFNSVYFQRFDYREKEARRKEKKLQMMWDTNVELGTRNPSLFTTSFYDSYCYPPKFCLDDKCHDENIRDDPNLEEYNVNRRVDEFIRYVNRIAETFATDHIIVPMGCDFTFENANMNFQNMDKLIHHTNARQANGSRINLLYSTPKCYTKAVNGAFLTKGSIAQRGSDFFPYASKYNAYWTGFYTSRPALKDMVRKASTLLTATEHHHLFANCIEPSSTNQRATIDKALPQLNSLRQSMGVLQHHDAVTGTEKQHVADDYAKRLGRGMVNAQDLVSATLVKLLSPLDHLVANQSFDFCPLVNISQCEWTENRRTYFHYQDGSGGVYLAFYNPLGWNANSYYARVPIHLTHPLNYNVSLLAWTNDQLLDLPVQIIEIDQRTLAIPERHSDATHEVVFPAASPQRPIPPLGYSLFFMAIHEAERLPRPLTDSHSVRKEPTSSSFYTARLETSPSTGVVVVFDNKQTGKSHRVEIEPIFYLGSTKRTQCSGAYIFLPANNTHVKIVAGPSFEFEHGQWVEEVRVTFADFKWITYIVRLFEMTNEVEVEWTVGPIPDSYFSQGREVVMRYTVDRSEFTSGGEFFTDSAGRRLIRRVRDQRSDLHLDNYTFKESQPVAGNYYPILNRVLIRSLGDNGGNPSLGVYTDRAQGASSLADGQLELMVHRRCTCDDGYGVGEALRETGADGRTGLIVRGKHKLVMAGWSTLQRHDFRLAQQISRPPFAVYGDAVRPPTTQIDQPKWQGLARELPEGVHLLSLSSWPPHTPTDYQSNPSTSSSRQILLRLESDVYSSKGQGWTNGELEIDVTDLFSGIRVIDAIEMSLTMNLNKTSMLDQRLHWPGEAIFHNQSYSRYSGDGRVILSLPLGKIATYLLTYQ